MLGVACIRMYNDGSCFPILASLLGELAVDSEVVASRHRSMVELLFYYSYDFFVYFIL